MRIHLSILTSILFLFSCCKEEEIPIRYDDRGAITSMPWLWRVSMTEYDYNGGFVSYPVYYNGGVLLGAENTEGINYLRFHDIKTGEVLWLQDYIYPASFFNISDPYLVKDAIIIRDGYDLFSMDLNSGEYNWKTRDNGWGFNWLTGIDSLFFTIDAVNDPKTGYPIISASVGNTDDGSLELFLIPDLGDIPEPDMGRVNMAIGGFRYVKPFFNATPNEIMLLCYYDKQYYLPESDNQISQSYMGLYNFSEKEWIYERKELGERNFLEGFTPTIIGDRVYHTLSEGVAECRNLYTGEVVWRNENDYQYSWISFIVVGDRMIVMDDWYENLIAYDTSNGHEIWRTTSGATIELMQELNGVVYFYCGSDACIHAVDAETGKYLWHLKSPDEENDYYDSFIRQCTVIPGVNGEKGRVVVSSNTHAYCYEAAR
jgi:outer membrane protein assembly factor BamB